MSKLVRLYFRTQSGLAVMVTAAHGTDPKELSEIMVDGLVEEITELDFWSEVIMNG